MIKINSNYFFSICISQLTFAQQSVDNGFNAYLKTGVAGCVSEKNLLSGRKEETNSQNSGLAFAVGRDCSIKCVLLTLKNEE